MPVALHGEVQEMNPNCLALIVLFHISSFRCKVSDNTNPIQGAGMNFGILVFPGVEELDGIFPVCGRDTQMAI
ncbi:MAG TPA: hypothetical protein DDZ40_03025 [Deltaproteobacteria bacterium]|nr:hypothetical protein [Deltaproteobacteria bacterium]